MALFNQMVEAQRRFQLELLSKRNVVGVALGYKNVDESGQGDEIAVVALVEQKKPLAALSADDVIPPNLDGARTDVVEVGYLQAFGTPTPGPRARWRPTIPPGVSMGHFQITAGTFGALVYDNATGEALVLSNNHVLANSNDASLGDAILQPGPSDGGQNPADRVATLYKYMPLIFTDETFNGEPTPIGPPGGGPPDPRPTPPPRDDTGLDGCAQLIVQIGNTLARLNGSQVEITAKSAAAAATTTAPVRPTDTSTVDAQAIIPTNSIDAAVAKPADPDMFSDEIRQIGQITGTQTPALGMQVRKSGRTTDFTTGTVTLINATVDVTYSTVTGTRIARFTNQVMTTPMSQGGDSGSLIVDASSQNAVGLLFAGSLQATIFSPIEVVLQKLGLRFTQ